MIGNDLKEQDWIRLDGLDRRSSQASIEGNLTTLKLTRRISLRNGWRSQLFLHPFFAIFWCALPIAHFVSLPSAEKDTCLHIDSS